MKLLGSSSIPLAFLIVLTLPLYFLDVLVNHTELLSGDRELSGLQQRVSGLRIYIEAKQDKKLKLTSLADQLSRLRRELSLKEHQKSAKSSFFEYDPMPTLPDYTKQTAPPFPEEPWFESVKENYVCKNSPMKQFNGITDSTNCWKVCAELCQYFAHFPSSNWCNIYDECDPDDLKQARVAGELFRVLEHPPTLPPTTKRPAVSGCQKPSVGLVAMTRHSPIEDFEFWLDYHFSIGFCHVFLRIQHTPYLRYLIYQPKYAGKITAIWLDNWKRVNPGNATDHQLKKMKLSKRDWQTLFVDRVCKVAGDVGIEWLFHFDDDEIWWNYGRGPVQNHLEATPERFVTVHYRNFESLYVPHNYSAPYPPFDVQTSQRNPATMSQGSLNGVPIVPDPWEHPPHKYSQPIFYKQGKHAYGNGKSSGRVSPILTTNGVHFFQTTDELKFNESRRAKPEREEMAILHYESGDFMNWARKFARYKTLDPSLNLFGFYNKSYFVMKDSKEWYYGRTGLPPPESDMTIRTKINISHLAADYGFMDKVPTSFEEYEFPHGWSP